MKKTTLTTTLWLSIIIIVMASCASTNFSSRKYTAGNYRTNAHKAPTPKTNETPKDETVYASSEKTLTESDFKTKASEVLGAEVKTNDTKSEASKTKLTFQKITPFKEIKQQISDFKQVKEAKKNGTYKKTAAAAKGEGLDTTALISLILSVLAIVCDVIGFLLVVATLQYAFLALFAVGLALGITGLIMGTKGLKNHRQDNGSVISLIFSIVGTALGGIAIILSIYYSIWSVVWIALSL